MIGALVQRLVFKARSCFIFSFGFHRNVTREVITPFTTRKMNLSRGTNCPRTPQIVAEGAWDSPLGLRLSCFGIGAGQVMQGVEGVPSKMTSDTWPQCQCDNSGSEMGSAPCRIPGPGLPEPLVFRRSTKCRVV